MTTQNSIFARYGIIRKIPIFQKLNWYLHQKIARVSTINEYKKGEFICRQGEPSDALYCLIYGRVRAYTIDQDGNKEVISFIRRGMPFGIISVLTGLEHSLNFEAINDSIILKIPKEDFQSILKTTPHLGMELSQSLSERIRKKIFSQKSDVESPIISVFSSVRGAGASTYAVNLANQLHMETKKKIVYVQLKRKDNDESVGEDASYQLHLGKATENYEEVKQHVTNTSLGINYLELYYAKNEHTEIVGIGQLVSSLALDYHHVVIDLSYDVDNVVVETLVQSDMVHIVSLDGKQEIAEARQMIYRLEEDLREHFNPDNIKVFISGREASCYLSFDQVNEDLDFDVYMKLPHIDQPEDFMAELIPGKRMIILPGGNDYSHQVRKVARQVSGISVGLVLGGGAALGIAHIGVLKVLEEEGIPVDIVVGSSMGALIAAFWTTGKNADAIEKVAKEFKSLNSMVKLFDPIIPKAGLIGGRLIRHWLKTRGLENKIFYSTTIPLKIVSYDLMKRQEIVIHSGSILEAVMQSIKIPGIIEPTIEKDKVIIDGGVLNPLPTNVLRDLGITKIIAVNVLQSPEHVVQSYHMEQEQLRELSRIPFLKSPWKFLKFRFDRIMTRLLSPNIADIVVRSLQASEFVIAEQSGRVADVLIHPNLAGINWFELYRVDDLMQRGEEAARKALPQLKELIRVK